MVKIKANEGKQYTDKWIKKNVKMAVDIQNKIEDLGMNNPPSGIGVNLADIYFTLESFRKLIDKLIGTDAQDKDAMEHVLIEIRIKVLDHINYHTKHVKRPLERVIGYCDEQNIT